MRRNNLITYHSKTAQNPANMEKNTIICDICDKHVAERKCEICSKDLCEDCSESIELLFMGNSENSRAPLFGTPLFDINTCERCHKQFIRVCLSEQKIFSDIMKDKPEIQKEIVETIKNAMMLKKITDEDEDIKEEKEEEDIIKKFHPYPAINPNPYPNYPYSIPPRKYPYLGKKNPYYSDEWKKRKKKWWGTTI